MGHETTSSTASRANRSRRLFHVGLRLVLIGVVSSCSSDGPSGPSSFDGAAEFDRFWRTFDEEYSYFELKQIDWDGLRAEFRPRALEANSRSGLVAVLKEMVTPLRDRHVNLIEPSGRFVATYEPDHFINWEAESWRSVVDAAGWVTSTPHVGHAWFGEIGYVMIDSWNGRTVEADDVDSVLELFREARALIIDVRPNGGGDDGVALDVAGRFTRRAVVTEWFQFRDGPRHDDLTALSPRTLEPRGNWQFERPVAVLSGRRVLSSNESFISAMRELPHVTIVGDTTGGSSGNPGIFDLGGDWKYTVSRWIAYTADLRVIEWQGIPPDVFVDVSEDDFVAGADPVIEAALTHLGHALAADRISEPAAIGPARAPLAPEE
jgi:hypothetical protein